MTCNDITWWTRQHDKNYSMNSLRSDVVADLLVANCSCCLLFLLFLFDLALTPQVVQNLPLSEISPAIIIFEAVHLPKKQMEATFKYLHKYDYYTTRYGQNGVAFKLSILSQIPINMRGAWTKKMLAKN